MKDDFETDPTAANRYLADQMAAQERADYEQWLSIHAEALQELESTARLKVGLAVLQDRGELAPLMVPGAPAILRRQPVREPRRAVVWALAASVVVAAVGVSLWRAAVTSLAPLAPTLAALRGSSGHALKLDGEWTVFRTRSAGDDATLPLPAVPGAVQLRVLPDRPARSGFRAELLQNKANQFTRIAIGEPLQAGADGFVQFYVDSTALREGEYQLVLTPIGGSADGSQYFHLRLTAPTVSERP